MGGKWTILLLVCVLLGCGNSLNWYGSGNWTPGNITFINQLLGTVDMSTATNALYTSAQSLSNQLNTAWDHAWNVVISYEAFKGNYDVVVCGYAFNGHWFWKNGVLNSNGYYLSFIIWKDYNCITWYTLNPGGPGYKATSYSTGIYDSMTLEIVNTFSDRLLSNIWLAAKDLQSKAALTPGILQEAHGYTVVASQSSTSQFVARICAKNYLVVGSMGSDGFSSDGSALILQMR